MEKLKYILCNDYEVAGGAETVFNTEFESLKKIDSICVSSIVFSNTKLSFLYIWFWLLMQVSFYLVKGYKVKVHIHNATTMGAIISLFGLMLLRRMVEFEQVHTVHDYALLCPSRVGLVYKENELIDIYPVNYNINDTFDLNPLKNLFLVFRFRVLQYLFKRMLINKIYAPSQHLVDSLKFMYPRLSIVLLRNPILKIGTPVLPTGIKNKQSFFIVGRLSKEKGVVRALTYWIKYHSECELTIIGDGPEINVMKSLVKGYDNVRFTGWVRNEDINSLIRGGVILYSAIWTENAPVIFLDAILSGARILCIKQDMCTMEFESIFDGLFIHEEDLTQPFNCERKFDIEPFSIESHVSELLS